MQLIAVKQARSIWLIYLADLNPRGHNLFPLVPLIIAKYNFLLFPNPNKLEEFDLQKGIKFANGGFQKDQQNNIEVNLTIYNDGFIADTRSSTKDSDAFLDDFLTYLAEEFNLVPYQKIIRTKSYVSELFVRTDKSLNALNPKLEKFAKRLTSLIEGHSHHPIAFETTGITFWTDPTITLPPGPFRFERIIDIPFSENRYYSAAPLQTEIHLELLEELENILSS
jgi:hypothetical protein